MADNIPEKPIEEKPFEIKLREEYKDKEVFEGKSVEELKNENKELFDTSQNLHELSIRDALTGLYNRRRMEAEFDGIRPDEEFAILIIDADDFKKEVNDKEGHAVGDEVLKKIANSILANVRSDTDSVYRYGGEEFVVLLRGKLSLDKLREIAEKIRIAVSRGGHRRSDESREVFVTVSIGGALRVEETHKPQEVLDKADNLMYQAKKKGKNRVVLDGEGKPDIKKETIDTVVDSGSQGNNKRYIL